MKFLKTMSRGIKVAAEGELWEKNGVAFMLEIPEDVTDCTVYGMAGKCSKCLIRHNGGCTLEFCRATEKETGLLVTTAKSKSGLINKLNRLNYDEVKQMIKTYQQLEVTENE